MKLLLLLLRYSRWRLVSAVVSGVVSGACAGALVAVAETALFAPAAQGASDRAALLFAVLVCMYIVTRMLAQSELLNVLQGKALPALRSDLARGIVAAPLRVTEAVGSGRLSGALMGDALAIGVGSMAWIFVVHSSVAVLVATLSVARISIPITLAMLGSMAVGLVIFFALSSVAQRYAARAQEHQGVVYRHLDALISGFKELALSSSRRRDFIAGALEPELRASHTSAARAAAMNDVSAAWTSMLVFVVIGVVLFFRSGASVESVGAAVVAILYAQSELACVLEQAPLIVRGNVVLRSVEGLGVTLHDAAEPAADAPGVDSWRKLTLEGVTHVYRREDADDRFTLGPIDLSLQPGEIVFVVGGNGSGKSTLGKLLVGLYAPESGEIRLDGKAIGADRMEHYRSHFSAIFSDYYLFDRLYGHHAADSVATEWLAELNLASLVTVADGKFSTIQLSQGQKKRLALVSAYLEDRPIYLFDEWAADQDPAFKQVFYTRLLPALKARGKTVVVITHDDRYFATADRVVRLHDGKLG